MVKVLCLQRVNSGYSTLTSTNSQKLKKLKSLINIYVNTIFWLCMLKCNQHLLSRLTPQQFARNDACSLMHSLSRLQSLMTLSLSHHVNAMTDAFAALISFFAVIT